MSDETKQNEKKLNRKKQMFCEEYMVDFNATRAAIKAGYSPDTASQKASGLLKEPEVKDYLNILMREKRQNLGISTAEIIEGLKQIAYLGEKDGDKIRAWELLGKYLGLWTEKKDININGSLSLEELSDEELEETLKELE